MSAVLIIKYTITPQTRLFRIYMQNAQISLQIPFTSSFKYHKALLDSSLCTKHSLKLSPCAHSLPTSSYKDILSFTLQKLQVKKYSTSTHGTELAGCQKASRFFERKSPMATASQRNLIWPTYYLLQYRNYLPLSNVKSNNQSWTCLSDNIRTNIKIPNVGRSITHLPRVFLFTQKAVISLIKQWMEEGGGEGIKRQM